METEKLELEMAMQDAPKSLKAELRRLHARVVELETEAIKESHRLAEANLRAAQMESQHKQAAEIATAVTKELAAKSEKIQELEALLESVGAGGTSAQRVTQSQTLKASSGWLIDGGLLYRLNDEGANCDEINVTLAGGLRTEAARVERAEAILNMLTIQKAADHIGKPSWDSHQWPQIVQDSSGNWFGVREGWTMRIAPSYKGDELWLLREDGEFLSHGECSQGWRTSLEQRPTTKPTPAELNLDDYYCKGCGRIGEIEELSAQDQAKLRKLDGKPKTAAAPVVLPEPDEYQYRMKGNWDAKLPWTPWEDCSKESAAIFRKLKEIHNWIYEVRERYTEQQVLALRAKDLDAVNLDRLGKALTKLGHATWVSQEEAAADIPRWVNALTSCVLEIPEAAPNWKWMTHPSHNNGNPIPVFVFVEGGVTYYRPFDTEATDFEWELRDDEWAEFAAPQPQADARDAERVTQGQRLGAAPNLSAQAPNLSSKSEKRKPQDAAIAGALYDFAGYLTTRPAKHSFMVGGAHNASPMVEALTAWAKIRGLSLDDADVEGWSTNSVQPLTHEQVSEIATPFTKTIGCDQCGEYGISERRNDIEAFARAIERAHGIGDTNGN